LKQDKKKCVIAIPKSVLLVVTILTLALFTSIYPIPWKTVSASPVTQAFYPSGYNLLGSTQYYSGTLSDLQSDNSVNMTFRSYVSATSTTTKTDAFIAYRSNTGTDTLNSPKNRNWDGDTAAWGGENEMPTAGSPVRYSRVAWCTVQNRSFEKIVVSISDDGYLDAYVWDGSAWNVTNNIGFAGTTANAYKPFDIIYELTSGEAMLVYGISSTNTSQDLAYRTWTFGTGWSSEYYINDTGHTNDIQYRWFELASKPTSGSNEITMIAMDGTDSDGNGWVWDGSSWGTMYELNNAVSIINEESIAVAYESQSGRAWTAAGQTTGTVVLLRSQTSGTWNSTNESPSVGGTPNWLSLKPDPSSNKLMLTSVDGSSDLNTVYYAGSGNWIVQTEHDAAVGTNARRTADFAWEPTGGKGLLVWGTTAGQLAYKNFTAPNTWQTQRSSTMGTKAHPWVQLKTNPRTVSGDVKILGVIMEGVVFDLGAIKWDGSTFTVIGSNTITTDTTLNTYECFELGFSLFGDPTEFTSEVEFTGTSNTVSWTQLVWTIDNSFTTTGVTTTFQLYNYNTSSYPTSGDGYMADTIGTANVTKTQTITVNPNYFRDATGNWIIKVKGVKSTSAQFDWKGDLVKIEGTWEKYKLNLRILDWDLTDAISNAYSTMNNGTDHVQVSDSNGWANYTGLSGTVTVKVQYFGFWVNGTFSVTVDSDKTINVQCKLYDVTVLAQEGTQNAYLTSANATVFNSTSVQGNKIISGITGNNGQVQLLNLPNNTLTFTQYGGASFSLVIGNTTQLISSENQAITLTANQNTISTNNNCSIIAFTG
jgi:hypothetical protein